MTSIRKAFALALLTGAAQGPSAWAANSELTESHERAQSPYALVAQATAPKAGMGMRAGTSSPDYADQMKAMQKMHDKAMATRTPQERVAMMNERRKLMESGMTMMRDMGGMGGGGAADQSIGMAGRQGVMEQRMEMMQSMMLLMMDNMQAEPVTKRRHSSVARGTGLRVSV